ncbi:MAG: ImmA/IrrE family metallo-endopeptidase [Bacilli bacterium]
MLATEKYEEIKKIVVCFLEDYDVKTLPIDVFGLAKKMNVNIVFASKIVESVKYKNGIDNILKYPESLVYFDKITNKFIVYIDDINLKFVRQRFSLAHELMHIILGHTTQNEQNENEAFFGATYLLAPTSLVLIKHSSIYLLDYEHVANIFEVSIPEAKIIARYNNNRFSLKKSGEENDYEKIINGLLRKSLEKKFIDICR